MRPSDREKYGIRIFISAVTDEFGSYRDYLRTTLEGPFVDVKIQENFTAWGTRTLEKLDDYIRACDAVIHLAGKLTGAVPHRGDVAFIMQKYPGLVSADGPLAGISEPDKHRISYTEWEAYLAAHHDRTLFIARPSGETSESQAFHLLRLEKAGRFSEITFSDERDLAIQMLRSNLRDIVPDRTLAHTRRERFGPHEVEILKYILLNESQALCNEQFIYNAFTQLTGSTLIENAAHDKGGLNAYLIDFLSEGEYPHVLLMLAQLCRDRAAVLALPDTVAHLDKWLTRARKKTGLSLKVIQGQCSAARDHLNVQSPPRPYIQVTWEDNPADPQDRKRVILGASLRWGRACDKLSVRTDAISRETSVAVVAEFVDIIPHYQELAYERFELTVPSRDLNYHWEYPPDVDPNDDLCSLYPWPVVLRLQRKPWERARVSPNNPMDPTQIACLATDCGRFLKEAKQRGAFFAAWPGSIAPDLETLRKAALWAGFGLWLRMAGASFSAESILSELAGRSLSGIPDWYFKHKTQADRSSPWRHVSLLYDLPDVAANRNPELEALQTEQALK